eukprot:TRINITY_DN2333_c0_g1_i1.p1 TRINITY_DN2333_c0_g1~~TRINITY_DN2333_c0_g1_i1.p1  ORF type:complete len:622 (+),score=171.66 TRINITY_DN2333_c0_g1_i1:191-2056(+)
MDFDISGLIGGGDAQDSKPKGRGRGGSNAGRSIHHHYEFIGELGKGAYGVVSKVQHKLSGAYYAVKQIDKKAAGSKGLSSVFSEVEILSVLHHPSIVHLEETFEDSSNLWLVLEFVAGGELETELRKHRFFPEATVRRIIGHLLLAMEHIHGKSIVHRDLKPANMLVSGRLDEGGNCELKLADFGFACLATNEATLTSFCGTIAFMAPEIIIDAPYGKPVDMWAIGVITYLLVCGTIPFEGATETEISDAICDCSWSFPTKRTDGGQPVSDGCRDFVKRLLVADPETRMCATEALHHWWIKGAGGGEVELDFYGADDVADGAPGAGPSGQSVGRKHPRLRWRKAYFCVRAAHRLMYWQRTKLLQEEQCDIPLLRNFTYLCGGHIEPPDGQVLVSGLVPTARGVQRVCEVVEHSRTCEVLDISGNNLSYDSLQAVLRAATTAPRLSSLVLSNNPINTLGGRAIMRLARSGKLRRIELKGTQIAAEVLQQVEQALRENDRPDRGGAPTGAAGGGNRPSRGHQGLGGVGATRAPPGVPARAPVGGARQPAARGPPPATAGAPSLFGTSSHAAAAAGPSRSRASHGAGTSSASPPTLPRIGGSTATAGKPKTGDPGHRHSGAGKR